MKVVYTPRAQVGISKLATSVKYDCQAYRDQEKKKKSEMERLNKEIERTNYNI